MWSASPDLLVTVLALVALWHAGFVKQEAAGYVVTLGFSDKIVVSRRRGAGTAMQELTLATTRVCRPSLMSTHRIGIAKTPCVDLHDVIYCSTGTGLLQ